MPLLVGAVVYTTRDKSSASLDFDAIDLPAIAEKLEGLDLAYSLGKPEATVEIREFSDYECPACALIHEWAWPTIRSYVESGQVRLSTYELVLPFHERAAEAAIYAACAEGQDVGKFWDYRHLLYSRRDEWSQLEDPAPFFRDAAQAVAMDGEQIALCAALSQPKKESIRQGFSYARERGLNFVPLLLVNDEVILGNSRDAYVEALQSAIERGINGANRVASH